MNTYAACLHKGDVVVIEGERLTIAKAEYSTPEPGKITFTMTDGQSFALSAIAKINVLAEAK